VLQNLQVTTMAPSVVISDSSSREKPAQHFLNALTRAIANRFQILPVISPHVFFFGNGKTLEFTPAVPPAGEVLIIGSFFRFRPQTLFRPMFAAQHRAPQHSALPLSRWLG
jgi:hypothetical protein